MTEKIEDALREVTVNAESVSEIESAGETANLFLSFSETFDLEESLAARFDFVKKYLAEKDKSLGKNFETAEITEKISKYKSKLRELGLEPENLSLSSQPFWYVFQHFFVRVGLMLLFLPFAIIGSIIHFPAYQLSKILASYYTHHGVDDIVSTVKIFSGIVFMPITWLILAGILYYFTNWKIALASIPFSFFCGYLALRSLEEFADLGGWFRAIWLFFRKRELFVDLLLERRALYKSLSK